MASRLVVFVALLAFALQAYVAQTHIHGQGFDGTVKISTTHSSGQGKTPLDNSPLDCPFCQAANLAGAFLDPAAIPAFLPLTWVDSIFRIFIARAVSGEVAHDWQSRAPPRR